MVCFQTTLNTLELVGEPVVLELYCFPPKNMVTEHKTSKWGQAKKDGGELGVV